jgi:branched-chain amino acid transport system permease protein
MTRRRAVSSRALIGAAIGLAGVTAVSVALWAGNEVTLATVSVTLITGVSLGAIYAMAASGIVVTYTATGVFNFAQGSMGMIMAFVFWELSVDAGIPTFLAVLLTVLVIAPIFGVLLEVTLMRRLVGTSLVVQLVVTIALMLGLMGLAQTLWSPATFRSVGFFFGIHGFHIGATVVLWHRALSVVAAAGLAVGLRLLLHRSRIGVTMRAVVDHRELAGLHGARPNRVSMLAWALSTSMAALAGILLAPEVGVAVLPLSLLAINTFAAAILGRLRSLPLTFAGALLLGVVITFAKNFLDLSGRWFFLADAIPALFLLVALLTLPESRLQFARLGERGKSRLTRTTSVPEAVLGVGVVFTVVLVVSAGMGQVNLNRLTLAIVTATLLLSYVPLTGWAGQVSLAQITFAGIGAFTMWKVAGSSGNPLGLLAAAAAAVPFGFLAALPALRLKGLYMALATMAFALVGEYLLFGQPEIFGTAGRNLSRPDILGIDFADQRTFLVAVTAIFAVLGVGVVWMRRRPFGRRLVALRDSEAASAMLGASPMMTKLAVFGLSAAIAGFAGGLLALQRTSASVEDFGMLVGIPLLLLVVIGGVATMSGALFGGLTSVLLIMIEGWWDVSFLKSIEILGPALLALGIVSNPDGAVVAIGRAFAPLLPWRADARAELALERQQRRASRSPSTIDPDRVPAVTRPNPGGGGHHRG